MSQKDVIVYETILGVPKMDEEVKVTVRLTRKNSLLLSQLIDRGLNDEYLKGIFPPETFDGLKSFQETLLSGAQFSNGFMENWRALTTR